MMAKLISVSADALIFEVEGEEVSVSIAGLSSEDATLAAQVYDAGLRVTRLDDGGVKV